MIRAMRNFSRKIKLAVTPATSTLHSYAVYFSSVVSKIDSGPLREKGYSIRNAKRIKTLSSLILSLGLVG